MTGWGGLNPTAYVPGQQSFSRTHFVKYPHRDLCGIVDGFNVTFHIPKRSRRADRQLVKQRYSHPFLVLRAQFLCPSVQGDISNISFICDIASRANGTTSISSAMLAVSQYKLFYAQWNKFFPPYVVGFVQGHFKQSRLLLHPVVIDLLQFRQLSIHTYILGRMGNVKDSHLE